MSQILHFHGKLPENTIARLDGKHVATISNKGVVVTYHHAVSTEIETAIRAKAQQIRSGL